jgi:hypothetical protein
LIIMSIIVVVVRSFDYQQTTVNDIYELTAKGKLKFRGQLLADLLLIVREFLQDSTENIASVTLVEGILEVTSILNKSS